MSDFIKVGKCIHNPKSVQTLKRLGMVSSLRNYILAQGHYKHSFFYSDNDNKTHYADRVHATQLYYYSRNKKP